MKILILGGTHFTGRHIVENLLNAGHSVSTFNRGVSKDELPATVERLYGDRDKGMSGLEVLSGRTWDVCVDVSGYTPLLVRTSAEKLRDNIGRYIFISAVSVYGDPPLGPVDENFQMMNPPDESITEITGENYGALKVACEKIIRDVYQNKFTILRPQIIAGPYDPLDRFSYWVKRSKSGGEMLAPGDGSDHVQFIAARDVARFTASVIEKNVNGIFNLSGQRITWKKFMKILGAENIVWVSDEFIRSEGLTHNELPLYRKDGSSRSSLMNVSNEAAVRAGLELTDIGVTVKDTWDWLVLRNEYVPALSPDIEKKLLLKYSETTD